MSDIDFVNRYITAVRALVVPTIALARRSANTDQELRAVLMLLGDLLERNVSSATSPLFVVCDGFVRQTVTNTVGIETLATNAHKLLFSCACAALREPDEEEENESLIDADFEGISLRIDEHVRLEHILTFTLLHLGSDFQLDDASPDAQQFKELDDPDTLCVIISRLQGVDQGMFNLLGEILFVHNEGGESFNNLFECLLAKETDNNDELCDVARSTVALELRGRFLCPSPLFFWCAVFPAALVVFAVVMYPRGAHDVERIVNLYNSPLITKFMTNRIAVFCGELAELEDSDKLHLHDIAERVVETFVQTCTARLSESE